MGLYYEDVEVDQTFTTAARTITEADVVAFAGLSGDYNPLHTDAESAKQTAFGERIAHGLLGFSIATGLIGRLGLFDGTTVGFLAIKDWSFKAPIFFGDTIHAEVRIVEKRETKKPDRGILVRREKIVNQRGEIVQEGDTLLMVKRHPAAISEQTV